MKGKKCILSLICSITLVLSSVLFSVNVSAVEQAVAQWSSFLYFVGVFQNNNCTYSLGNSNSPGYVTSANNQCTVTGLQVHAENISATGWQVSPNDYLEFTFAVYNTNDNDYGDSYFSAFKNLTNNPATIGMTIVDVDMQSATDSTGIIKILVKPDTTGTINNTFTFGNLDIGLKNDDVIKPLRLTKWNVVNNNSGANTQAIINAIMSNKSTADTILVELRWNNQLTDDQKTILNNILTEVQNMSQAQEDMNDKDDQDRDNIEQQSEQASTDSDSSQADVEELGSNFADYVGGVATALGASPTDCKIRANFGIGNFDAGEVDLCELSLPQEFQIIGSILLIGFVVPLAWATLNKIIALIRSFQ